MPNRPPLVKKMDEPKKRQSTNARGYDARYKKLRRIRLEEHPICEVCNEAFSTQAHHLVYTTDLQLSDLKAVCNLCHSKIHRGEK